jgi:hypothetical protein
MERRTFSVSAATDVTGMSSGPAVSQSPAVADQPLAPIDLKSFIGRLLRQFVFKPAYVEHVIVPFSLMSINQGERLSLPMIDVTLTKENELPSHLLGMFTENWTPSPDDGVTVFLQALEKRGPDNRRKRI